MSDVGWFRTRWYWLLEISGWRKSPVLGVLSFGFGLVLLAGLGVVVYFGWVLAQADLAVFAGVYGGGIALVVLIWALVRRCPYCKRWFGLRIVSQESRQGASGSALVRTISGRDTVRVATSKVVITTSLRCRHCKREVVRHW